MVANTKRFGMTSLACRNEQAAQKLKNMIQAEIPGATVAIGKNRGLCSYYAETGGLLVGYEKTKQHAPKI